MSLLSSVTKVTEAPQWRKFLIYGDSGAGKTRLAGSAQSSGMMAPVLLVDVEGGVSTLLSCYPDVDVVRIKSWKEMQQLYDELFDMNHTYRTVIIDSLTEVQKLNLNDIMVKANASNPKVPLDVPSMREWGISLEQMRKFTRAFRDLEMNVIFTSLADSGREVNTGKPYAKPLLTGKFVNEVQAFFDQVFYLYVKEVENEEGNRVPLRVLQTGATENFVAKDRSGKLPTYLADPTFDLIINTMNS